MASSLGLHFDWGQRTVPLSASASMALYDRNAKTAVPRHEATNVNTSNLLRGVSSQKIEAIAVRSQTLYVPPESKSSPDQLDSLDFYATGARSKTIPDISPETWIKLKDVTDSLRLKLEYRSSSRTLTVTHPSGVHEAVHILYKPFTQLAQAKDGEYLVEWNRDVPIELPEEFTEFVPDFVFGKCGDPYPKYWIIFECAWGQSDTDLDHKVDEWFKLADVVAVICLYITESEPFHSPSDPSVGYRAKDKQQFLEQSAASTPFGGITCEGHPWVAPVTAITLKIHHRNFATESYEVMPSADDAIEALQDRQEAVDLSLVRILDGLKLLGRLEEVFGEDSFSLNWDAFYAELKARLQNEAYNRYLRWAKPRVKRKDRPQSQSQPDRTLLPRPLATTEQVRLVKKRRLQ
ncbi:hypothetical protein R3P38DRAFT_2590648 [Favolaschia claudopus]|uniref:Uncharacterized protein n=1 Tax=Favolaschia claudopus TaxID=2862362 RepID=A0AAV9YZS8_9AGAR